MTNPGGIKRVIRVQEEELAARMEESARHLLEMAAKLRKGVEITVTFPRSKEAQLDPLRAVELSERTVRLLEGEENDD